MLMNNMLHSKHPVITRNMHAIQRASMSLNCVCISAYMALLNGAICGHGSRDWQPAGGTRRTATPHPSARQVAVAIECRVSGRAALGGPGIDGYVDGNRNGGAHGAEFFGHGNGLFERADIVFVRDRGADAHLDGLEAQAFGRLLHLARCDALVRLQPDHKGILKAEVLDGEWIDAGTFESLYKASTIVRENDMGIDFNHFAGIEVEIKNIKKKISL